jgi:hypothetical protein
MKKQPVYSIRGCDWCGDSYQPRTSREKHCSVDCRFYDKANQYKKVKPSQKGCWEWQGSTAKSGYGQMAIGSDRPELTHRLSYKYYIGDIPEGRIICHHCDNRKCFNPAHLYAGTYRSNVEDMYKRGRENNTGKPKGEAHHAVNITNSEAKTIYDITRDESIIKKDVAENFGVSVDVVRCIARKAGRYHNVDEW